MASKTPEISDADLDALMDAMAAEQVVVPERLMARVAQDALDHRPVPVPSGFKRPGKVQSFLDTLLGGWAGAGGLVTAGLIGLWVGVNPPSALEDTTGEIWDVLQADVTGGWSDFGDTL